MSSSSSSFGKMITLTSSDGQGFEVDISVASESPTIKTAMEDHDCEKNIAIPLPNVQILSKVIEYCKKHVEAAAEDDMLKDWDAEFVKVDTDTLFDLTLAANYLEIKGLTDLTCQTIADMIKGKTPDQIRETLNIQNDFTPEEEAEIQKETAWAFQ